MRTPTLSRNLAVNMKAHRISRGLTQETLADRTKFSVAYVSLLERAARTAPLTTVERVAAALEVPSHELLVPPSRTALQLVGAED